MHLRYEYTAPDDGKVSPSSAKLSAPSREKMPQTDQIMRVRPTELAPARTPFGEMKIPEPIMMPTLMATPLMREIVRFI